MGLIAKVRTTLGFGVHSPFAYAFIRYVLRERGQYYAYRRIAPQDRLLFRVANHFQPQTATAGDAHSRRIIALACPQTRFLPNGGDFLCLTEKEALNGDFRVLYAQRAERVGEAMTFTNGRVTVAVRRKGLPFQQFKLFF